MYFVFLATEFELILKKQNKLNIHILSSPAAFHFCTKEIIIRHAALFVSTLSSVALCCIVHMQWLCIWHTLHVFIAIILYIIENLELLKQSFLCKFCLILLNNLRYFFFYASHIILLVTSFCIY